jgi:SAM-dependent methyltransferase
MYLVSKILKNPKMWDIAQKIFGCDEKKQHMYRAVMDKPGKILDFGCSDGNAFLGFKDMEYYGLDIDKTLIEFAKQKYADFPNAKFIADDIFNKPFEENFFDHVLFACTGHHLPEDLINKVMKELCYVLKPGGALYIFDTIRRPGKDPWYIRSLIALDQGKHMKTETWYKENMQKFDERFTIEETDVFKVGGNFAPQPTWFYAKLVKK